MKKIIYILFTVILATGCSVEPIDQLEEQEALLHLDAKAQKGNPHASFDVPTLEAYSSTENSLQILIEAGETGATGGLSIRWMTWEDYNESGWNDDLAGHVLLNGHANEAYSLEAGEEFIFSLEDHVSGEGDGWNRDLECGQTYVFIVQAHQDGKTQKSAYSEPEVVSTAACQTNDPCDRFQNISRTICTTAVNNPTLQGFSAYYRAQISLSYQEINTLTGTFSPTMADLLTQYNTSGGVGTFTTTYTVTTADCGQVSFDVSVTINNCP